MYIFFLSLSLFPSCLSGTAKMCFSHFLVANRARLEGFVYFQAYCKNWIKREMISSTNVLWNLLGSCIGVLQVI